MKTRVISTILALCMVLSFVPSFAIFSSAEPQITVESDSVSVYGPTQIINGDFSIEPWMSYVYEGDTITELDECYDEGELVDSLIPNGVGGGWNTTDIRNYSRGSLFEYYNGYGVGRSGNGGFIEMNLWNSAVLYQDLNTVGGDIVRWTLKHCAREDYGDDPQIMFVQIGAPEYKDGNIVYAEGINSNVNSHIQKSTLATYTYNGITDGKDTLAFANAGDLDNLCVYQYDDNWNDVSGIYLIPEGQNVTRFAFIATGDTPDGGNLLDDITFSTLIGNLNAKGNSEGGVSVTGYWGDADSSKQLCIKIGSVVYKVNMQSVLNKNFKINVPKELVGDEKEIEIYHEDYEIAKKTVKIAPAVYLNDFVIANNTIRTYSYPEAVVSGFVQSLMITVENGSFEVPGYTATVSDLSGLSKTYIVNSADEAQAILRAAKFTAASDKTEQNIKVTASGDPIDLKGKKITITQEDEYGVIHYYGYVQTANADDFNQAGATTFTEAYAQAKTLVFNGLKGYLATITSAEENALLDRLTLWKGWGGAGRVQQSEAALNGDTFYNGSNIINGYGPTWYWVCGPEAGQAVTYSYWGSGEPNGGTGIGSEYLLMLHHTAAKTWNDINNTSYMLPGYFVEWSENTRDTNEISLTSSVEGKFEIHQHCDCGSCDCTASGHDATKIWTPWTSKTTLPATAGYYYLTKDVTVLSEVKLADGVHLCLNGHTVNGKYYNGAADCKTCSVELGKQVYVSNGVYSVDATVNGTVRSLSITVTNAKLKLTSVSGSGYTFKNGVVSSTTAHSTPNTYTEYTSIQLIVNCAADAEAALKTIRYTSISASGAKIDVSASATSLKNGDYYINGHYYTLSQSGTMSWEQAMEWAFNLQTTDPTRYKGYKSYPVVITSMEENQMLVNIWNNNGSSTKRQIFLPAVPVNIAGGTISVKGTEGNRDVVVTGEPYCADIFKNSYGHGEVYMWMEGTPEYGTTLPNENGKTHVFWEKENPTNGGMVYFGHPSAGACWDDLCVGGQWGPNVWNYVITSNTFYGHMYALAEWEPVEAVLASASKDLVNHTHKWEYSVGNVKKSHDSIITETVCVNEDGCSYEGKVRSASVRLAVESKVYDGLAYTGATLVLTNWTESGNETPVIKYVGINGTDYAESAVAPTNAGLYSAKITVSGKTAYVDFIIAKAASDIDATVVNMTYNGTEQSLIDDTVVSGGTAYYAIGTDDKFVPATGWSTSVPTAKDAGTYFVWYKAMGDKNHADSTEKVVKATIERLDISEFSIGKFDTMVYDGTEKTLDAVVYNDDFVATGTWNKIKNVWDEAVFTANGNFVGTVSTTGTIVRTIVIISANDKTKTYSDADPVFDVKTIGARAGDTFEYKITRVPGENAGSYKINVTGSPVQGNYNVFFTNGTLTIKKLDISNFTIGDFAPMTYNGQEQTPSATVSNGKLTATGTWNKVKNVEDEAVFTANGNFIGTVSAASVMARLNVTVEANNAGKTYSESDPELTAVVTGTIGDDKIDYTLERTAGEDAGTYDIIVTCDAAQGNYNVTTVNAEFKIERLDISDFTIGEFDTMTYNGKAQTPSATVFSGELTATGTWSDVTNVWDEAVFYADGNFIGTVSAKTGMEKIKVTVTAEDASKVYGEDDPELLAIVADVLDADSIDYTIAREIGEEAGVYDIIPSGDEIQGNYTVEYVVGKFFIAPQVMAEKKDSENEKNSLNNKGIEINNKIDKLDAVDTLENPPTGDDSNIVLWIAISAVISSGAVAMFLRRKKDIEE